MSMSKHEYEEVRRHEQYLGEESCGNKMGGKREKMEEGMSTKEKDIQKERKRKTKKMIKIMMLV